MTCGYTREYFFVFPNRTLPKCQMSLEWMCMSAFRNKLNSRKYVHVISIMSFSHRKSWNSNNLLSKLSDLLLYGTCVLLFKLIYIYIYFKIDRINWHTLLKIFSSLLTTQSPIHIFHWFNLAYTYKQVLTSKKKENDLEPTRQTANTTHSAPMGELNSRSKYRKLNLKWEKFAFTRPEHFQAQSKWIFEAKAQTIPFGLEFSFESLVNSFFLFCLDFCFFFFTQC